jgi:hypothetical protein
MQVTGSWTIFLFGCGGGACLELLRWWKVRESENFPDYASRPAYWILTFAMIIAGGVLAVVYGAGPTNAIQAMNIGAAALRRREALIRRASAAKHKPDAAASASSWPSARLGVRTQLIHQIVGAAMMAVALKFLASLSQRVARRRKSLTRQDMRSMRFRCR